ncbi:MAG: hypothetical protein HY858_08640, partial [Candidatus Solibacter usitatus]|nr:hypothetical protein [Candidatus Solibacter usitatus]
MRLPWPKKPLLAIATFCVGIALPQLIPQWYNWRVFEWGTVPMVLDFQPRKMSVSPVAEELERLRPDMAPVRSPESRIVDSTGAMESFYASLLRVERQQAGAVARILHYGDSP